MSCSLDAFRAKTEKHSQLKHDSRDPISRRFVILRMHTAERLPSLFSRPHTLLETVLDKPSKNRWTPLIITLSCRGTVCDILITSLSYLTAFYFFNRKPTQLSCYSDYANGGAVYEQGVDRHISYIQSIPGVCGFQPVAQPRIIFKRTKKRRSKAIITTMSRHDGLLGWGLGFLVSFCKNTTRPIPQHEQISVRDTVYISVPCHLSVCTNQGCENLFSAVRYPSLEKSQCF
jgi:hypothetical protein